MLKVEIKTESKTSFVKFLKILIKKIINFALRKAYKIN